MKTGGLLTLPVALMAVTCPFLTAQTHVLAGGAWVLLAVTSHALLSGGKEIGICTEKFTSDMATL